MESGEQFHVGDVAITNSKWAGTNSVTGKTLGEGHLIIVTDTNGGLPKLLYGEPMLSAGRYCIAEEFLELVWRPDATAE